MFVAGEADAGIGAEEIDRSKPTLCLLDELPVGVRIRDIGVLSYGTYAFRHPFDGCLVEVGENQPGRRLLGESAGQSFSNPATCPRDDDDFVL